jgi:hypothetical protein
MSSERATTVSYVHVHVVCTVQCDSSDFLSHWMSEIRAFPFRALQFRQGRQREDEGGWESVQYERLDTFLRIFRGSIQGHNNTGVSRQYVIQ